MTEFYNTEDDTQGPDANRTVDRVGQAVTTLGQIATTTGHTHEGLATLWLQTHDPRWTDETQTEPNKEIRPGDIWLPMDYTTWSWDGVETGSGFLVQFFDGDGWTGGGGGGGGGSVTISATAPPGTDHTVGTIWIVDNGASPNELGGVWDGTGWALAVGISQDEGDARYFRLNPGADQTVSSGNVTVSNGLTVSGALNLSTATVSSHVQLPAADPTSDYHAAHKLYVDTADASVLAVANAAQIDANTANAAASDSFIAASNASAAAANAQTSADTAASAASTAVTAINDHVDEVATPDPHPMYLTQSEGDALYDASGTAASAVTAHEALADPHSQYLTQSEGDTLYDAAGTAASAATAAVTAHEALPDPHSQYMTESESDTRYVNTAGDTMTGALTVQTPFTVTNARPIVLNAAEGRLYFTGSAGGWAQGIRFKGFEGTNYEGFGALGSGDALTHLYIGNDWNTPWMKFTGAMATLATDLTGTGTASFTRYFGNSVDSAGAPAFSFNTASNIGMYYAGTDQLGFSTGGLERLRLANTTSTFQTSLAVNAVLTVNGAPSSVIYGNAGVGGEVARNFLVDGTRYWKESVTPGGFTIQKNDVTLSNVLSINWASGTVTLSGQLNVAGRITGVVDGTASDHAVNLGQLDTKADGTNQIIAGEGLTGGGSLSDASITLTANVLSPVGGGRTPYYGDPDAGELALSSDYLRINRAVTDTWYPDADEVNGSIALINDRMDATQHGGLGYVGLLNMSVFGGRIAALSLYGSQDFPASNLLGAEEAVMYGGIGQWQAMWYGPTVAYSTAESLYAGASLEVTITDSQGRGTVAASADGQNAIPVTPDTALTFVFSVKSQTAQGNARPQARFYEISGVEVGGSAGATIANSTDWTEHRHVWTVPSNAVYARVGVEFSTTAQGSVHWVDKVGLWHGNGGDWALPGDPIHSDFAYSYTVGGTLPRSASWNAKHYFIVQTGGDTQDNDGIFDGDDSTTDYVPPQAKYTPGDWIVSNGAGNAQPGSPLFLRLRPHGAGLTQYADVSTGWVHMPYQSRYTLATSVELTAPLATGVDNVQEAIDWLNANKSDSNHTHSQYLRNDTAQTTTGNLTIQKDAASLSISSTLGVGYLNFDSANSYTEIQYRTGGTLRFNLRGNQDHFQLISRLDDGSTARTLLTAYRETGTTPPHIRLGVASDDSSTSLQAATAGHVQTKVPQTRLVSTGTFLTGGGSLAGDLSLNLDTGQTDARYLVKSTTANQQISGMQYIELYGATSVYPPGIRFHEAGRAYHRIALSRTGNDGLGVYDGAAGTTLTNLETAEGTVASHVVTKSQLDLKAPLASPTFTGTVTLPASTSIGNVSSTELGYLDGVTSGVQTQLNAKAPLASPTFTGMVTLPELTYTKGPLIRTTGAVRSTQTLNAVVGQYSSHANGVTGALLIELPTSPTNAMQRIEVRGYTYNGSGSAACEFCWVLSGYDYPTSPGFINTTARVFGSGLPGNRTVMPVKFLYKGVAGNAQFAIQIGDTDTVWYYPQIVVETDIGFTGRRQAESVWPVNITTDVSEWTASATRQPYLNTADRWETSRTLSLSGDLSGSVAIDGSANVTLSAQVADDSHNHVISNVDGLQSALDAKAPIASPTFTGTAKARMFKTNRDGTLITNLGDPTLEEMALIDAQFTNKLRFYDPQLLTFEYTTDGSTWVEDTAVTDLQKKRFVAGADAKTLASIDIPRTAVKYRLTIRNNGSYVYLGAVYADISTSGNTSSLTVWKKRDDGSWIQHTTDTSQKSSWPGHWYIPFTNIPWSTASTAGHYNEVRLEWTPTWTHATNTIRLSSLEIWGGYPAGRRTIYTVDEDKDVDFPAQVSSAGLYRTDGSTKYEVMRWEHNSDTIYMFQWSDLSFSNNLGGWVTQRVTGSNFKIEASDSQLIVPYNADNASRSRFRMNRGLEVQDEFLIYGNGNPTAGGGGSIRTAGSRFTMVLKPRNADSTYADDRELYYDSSNRYWAVEGAGGATTALNVFGRVESTALRASGDLSFAGTMYMDNAVTMQARNSAGSYQQFLWPRWSDDRMYLNYGANGFRIRDSASSTALEFDTNKKATFSGDVTVTGKTTTNNTVLGNDQTISMSWYNGVPHFFGGPPRIWFEHTNDNVDNFSLVHKAYVDAIANARGTHGRYARSASMTLNGNMQRIGGWYQEINEGITNLPLGATTGLSQWILAPGTWRIEWSIQTYNSATRYERIAVYQGRWLGTMNETITGRQQNYVTLTGVHNGSATVVVTNNDNDCVDIAANSSATNTTLTWSAITFTRIK